MKGGGTLIFRRIIKTKKNRKKNFVKKVEEKPLRRKKIDIDEMSISYSEESENDEYLKPT